MRSHPILISLLVISVLLGVVFRLSGLETKAYWFDETFTSLRISGYTDRELIEKFQLTNDLVSAGDLQKFQMPQPGRTLVDTVKGLAIEEPQNAPLYFVAAKLWADATSGSIYSTRLLAALFSLLVLPLVYWLCLELFASVPTAWVAVAAISLSPLHVLFAQTARPQSLWTAAMIFSSAALLRALRTKSFSAWGLYALGLIVCLYTFVLSGFFIFGFGLYVLVLEKFRWTKSFVACAVSSVIAVLAFLPWALLLYAGRSNFAATTSWTESKLSFVELVRAWIAGAVRLFFDINNQAGDPIAQLLPFMFVLPLILALIGYSLYYLYRNSPRRTWLFIVFLMGSAFLPLAMFDVLNGGSRTSAAQRYLIPTYIGLQLSVAFLLSQKLVTGQEGTRAWQGAAFLLLLLGGASCLVSNRAESWWNKDPEGANPEIARIINRSAAPLVISDGWMGHLLSLSSALKRDVKLRIDPLCYVCSRVTLIDSLPVIPDGFSDVFYFHPGWEPTSYLDPLRRSFGSNNVQPVVVQRNRVALWKVIRPIP